MAFDYGVDPSLVIKQESNIKIWPTEGRRTALVDADSIPYIVGYTSDMAQYLKAKRSGNFSESQVFKDKCDHANYLLNRWITNAGCDSAILYLTDGSDNFRLKIATAKPYKGQRVDEKPPFFYEIKLWLQTFHNAKMSCCCEADDEISIEAWKRILAFDGQLWTDEHKAFSDFVIISGDKDLGIIPTWRCQPDGNLEWINPLGYIDPVWKSREITAYEYWPVFKGQPISIDDCVVPMKYAGSITVKRKEDLICPKDKWEMDHIWWTEGPFSSKQDVYSRGEKKGKGKFKRVQVGKKPSEYIHKLKGGGLKFFYSQLLTGDSVDNYPGLPGVGFSTAYELLNDAKSEQELVSRVRQLYISEHKGDIEAALKALLEQGRLAWMQTRREELWNIPSSQGQSFPG